MAYPFDAIIPATAAGLTLTASVVSKAGAALGAQPAATIVDLGGGLYLYTTDAMPDGHRGAVKLLNGTTVVGAAVVTPRESENGDIRISDAQMLAAQLLVTPVLASVSNPRYSTRNLPPAAQGSEPTDAWLLADSTGVPLNLVGKLLRFVAYKSVDPNNDVPYDEIETPLYKCQTGGDGIIVGGAGGNDVKVTRTATKTALPGDQRYWLWNVTDKLPLAKGKCPIEPAVIDYP